MSTNDTQTQLKTVCLNYDKWNNITDEEDGDENTKKENETDTTFSSGVVNVLKHDKKSDMLDFINDTEEMMKPPEHQKSKS